MNLWGGRFTKPTNQLVYDFNASIKFDKTFASQDIKGSIGHVKMLTKQEILTQEEGQLIDLLKTIHEIMKEHIDTIMPGFTHLQKAQPITLAHHMGAYFEMFKRDQSRLHDIYERMDYCPLGSGALAGTTYPLDREYSAEILGFKGPCLNSIDGVSDRDYLIELLTTMKGLPLAYNKDMQEDKEMYFDALNTTKGCLQLLSDMLKSTTFNKDKMKKSATGGFTNATDAADYLVNKGVPFRDAHGIIGQLVLYAISQNKDLDELSLEELKNISDVFEEDVYQAIDVNTCVNKRNTIGACGQEMMKKVIALNEEYLKQF